MPSRCAARPSRTPPQLHYIFGRVASSCSEGMAAALDALQPPLRTAAPGAAAAAAAWEAQRRGNAASLLQVGGRPRTGLAMHAEDRMFAQSTISRKQKGWG